MAERLFPIENGMTGTARTSHDLRYRYTLERRWAPRGVSGDGVLWVMLNPSTADAREDDHTIRRCIAFSRGFLFRSLTVVNLFALRTTYPAELRRAEDPVGPDNGATICKAAQEAQAVIVAWGAHPFARQRSEMVLAMIRRNLFYTTKIHCLGPRTMKGFPRHPARLAADLPMEVFRG